MYVWVTGREIENRKQKTEKKRKFTFKALKIHFISSPLIELPHTLTHANMPTYQTRTHHLYTHTHKQTSIHGETKETI